MVIDDAKLFQGLIQNLADLVNLAPSPQAQTIIQSSQTMTLELWRRADVQEAVSRYDAGRQLLVDVLHAQTPLAAPVLDAGKLRVLRQLLAGLPETLPLRADRASREEFFERIRRGVLVCLDGSAYPIVHDPRLTELMEAMFEWERAGYALKIPASTQLSADETLVVVDAAMLQRYLRRHCGGYEDASVIGFTPIAGGYSKQTILFDVQLAGREEGFVYRGTTKIQITGEVVVDIAHEFHVVSYAFEAGVPVAEPVWLQSNSDVTGTRFFVSRRVPGANFGTAVRAHAQLSAAATRSLGAALATIHALPLDSTNDHLRKSHLRAPSAGVQLQDVIRHRVEQWREYFRSLDPPTYPTLELAFQWLLDNASASDEDTPVVVHGDYGLHNILIHEDRVSAVLDWEACHLGDRALDLSHILTGTAGSMDHALFMDAYVAAGGRNVSGFRLKYYQVLMSMQFMVSTIDAQHIFQRRAAAGSKYCTLGLGYIAHTANSVINGIMEAAAAKEGV